ncbi:MAG TPA: AAA family ATPase, partial [Aquihabitans sp.]|nr:AAA family ATPase [Aquihabitans sp.]
MRPHHLTIEAMGPYAEEVAVDFDELAHEGLFLIHGPTGSGKTSLLDALCFALYGEVPGERGERGLRSDHAAPGATPRVALEFTAQGGRYRVVREPFHEAAKKRGPGTTTRHPTATLVRLDAGHERTVATKPSEVREEIRHLVGLTPSQFQQVILLPQGQFEEVLRGRAETREGLLKTLFHTVGYEQLTAWLADEARRLRAEVDAGRRHLVVLAEEARRRGAELGGIDGEGPADGEKLFEADRALGTPDHAGLERLAARATAELAEVAAAREAAQLALADATGTFEQCTAVAERWDRRRRAVVEGERLAAAAPAIAADRAAKERAELAEQIRPSLAEVARRAAEQRRAAAGCVRRLAEVEQARRALIRELAAVSDLDLEAPPSAAALGAAGQAVAAELATMEALAATARREAEHRTEAAGHRREEAAAAALA